MAWPKESRRDYCRFRELTRLKELWLHDTQVTDAGVAELEKALPNCEITR